MLRALKNVPGYYLFPGQWLYTIIQVISIPMIRGGKFIFPWEYGKLFSNPTITSIPTPIFYFQSFLVLKIFLGMLKSSQMYF